MLFNDVIMILYVYTIKSREIFLYNEWKNSFFFRFYSFWDEELKFTLIVPSIAGYIMSDLVCCECDVRLYADCLPSNHLPLLSTIYELQLTKLFCLQVEIKTFFDHFRLITANLRLAIYTLYQNLIIQKNVKRFVEISLSAVSG